MNTVRRLAALAIVGSVAACGGGSEDNAQSGGNNTDLTLNDKSDALKEIGVVSGIVDGISRGGFNVNSTKSSNQSKGLKSTKSHFESATPSNKSRYKTVEQCSGGGTIDSNDGEKEYAFNLFDNQSVSVNFFSFNGNNCVEQNGDSTFTYNGYSEFGYPNNEGSTSYFYYEDGKNGQPIVSEIESSSFNAKYSELGLGQEITTSTRFESREITTYSADITEDGDAYDATISLGKTGTPFVEIVTQNGTSVSGPFSYSTSECRGGSGTLSTPVVLTFDQDDGFLNGGQLKLVSGNSSATYTFNQDGSATYQLGNGASGTLSKDELSAAVDGDDC